MTVDQSPDIIQDWIRLEFLLDDRGTVVSLDVKSKNKKKDRQPKATEEPR